MALRHVMGFDFSLLYSNCGLLFAVPQHFFSAFPSLFSSSSP